MAKKPRRKWAIYQVVTGFNDCGDVSETRYFVGTRWAVSAAQAISFYVYSTGTRTSFSVDMGHDCSLDAHLEAVPI